MRRETSAEAAEGRPSGFPAEEAHSPETGSFPARKGGFPVEKQKEKGREGTVEEKRRRTARKIEKEKQMR